MPARRGPASTEPARRPIRLQKLLAPALGISRRDADALIEAGRVSVDGRQATPGQRALPSAEIAVDGRALPPTGPVVRRVLLYHKAVGEECSRNPGEGRPGVFRALPPLRSGRWQAVGRLDVTTSGLLLLTTDGELAHRLMHPSGGFDREYLVRVQGELSQQKLQQLKRGVELEDGPARFADLVPGPDSSGANRWYCVTLLEGRNRLIHRLFGAVGCRVGRLRRIRFGPLWLPRGLRPGGWSELRPAQIAELERWPQR